MLEFMCDKATILFGRRLIVAVLVLFGVVITNTALLARPQPSRVKIESLARKKGPPKKPEPSKKTKLATKKPKIPRKGPLPENSECTYRHLKGKIRNEYGPHPVTKARVWLRSFCAVTVPSSPSAKEPLAIGYNQFPLPHGWLSMINEHTQETLCINIWTGQDCPTSFRTQDLLQQPSPIADWNPTSRMPHAAAPSPEPPTDQQASDLLLETSPSINDENTDKAPSSFLFPMAWHTPFFGETEEQARALTIEDLKRKATHEKEVVENMDEEESLGNLPDKEEHANRLRMSFLDYRVDRIVETDLPPLHPRAEEKIERFCRHYLNEHQRRIYPRTIMMLSLIYEHFQDVVHVQSAHRFQARTTSRHYGGRATDVWVNKASKLELALYVWSIGKCRGVGVIRYPDGFVHIDSRDPPSYWAEQVYYVVRSAFKGTKDKNKNRPAKRA